MKAAVVRSFDAPPRYEEFTLPVIDDDDAVTVDVLAAALHPRVKSGAAGRHYADEKILPMIPGIDAVGSLNGKLVYCVVHDSPFGSMAEKVVVDKRRCIPLPDGVDEAVIAAGMNPGMSSWIALRLRAPIEKGQNVFVLGATGNAGQMAIRIAKLLGAGRVVGAGREVSRLEGSGADEVVSLVGDDENVDAAIGKAAADADIVLDYLWSKPAAQAMTAILRARKDRSKPLAWVQIGAIVGPSMELPSVALRSNNLTLMGSGQGSVAPRALVGELPALVAEFAAGRLPITAKKIPLADVEKTWNAPASGAERVVFTP